MLILSCYWETEVTITNNMKYYCYSSVIPKHDGWLILILEVLKEFNLNEIIIVIHPDGVSVMVFISSVYADRVVPERLKASSVQTRQY